MTLSDRRAGDGGVAGWSRGALFCASATVVVIVAAAIVVLSLFFDARIAFAAKTLPSDAVAWGRFLSDIGTSGWMFTVAGALTIGPLVARRMLRDRSFDAALTVLGERAGYVLATLATQALAAQLIKHLVGRARPKLLPALGPYSFDVLSMKSALASFPSGHTATATAMAVAMTLLVPRLRVALFTLAAAIATSRIIVQAHYISDIAAGCVLGIGTALLVARLFADRRIAFTRRPDGIRLKDRGLIAATLARAGSTSP